jgi:hypothetical protein
MLSCGLCNETYEEETATQLWPQNDTEEAYQENETRNLEPESKAGEASTKARRCKRKHKEGKRVSTGSLKKAKLARTRNVAGSRTGRERTSADKGDAAGKEKDTSTRKEGITVSTGSLKKAKLARTRNVAGRKTGRQRTSAGNGDAAGKEIDMSTCTE